MNHSWSICGAGGIDEHGIAGASGVVADFAALGIDAEERLRWQTVSTSPYADFRRLDPTSKALVLAAETIDWSVLPQGDRQHTAMLLGSEHGCLHTDLQFAASLTGPGIAAGLFAFTLPSTPLGVLALRHGLGGPTVALSLPMGRHHEVLQHAGDLLTNGAAAACLCCFGDWLPTASALRRGRPPRTKMVALLLAKGESTVPTAMPFAVPTGADAAATVLDFLRREHPRG
jgi:hypothetical protein